MRTTSPFALVFTLVLVVTASTSAFGADVVSAGGGFVPTPGQPSGGTGGTVVPPGAQGPAGSGAATVAGGTTPAAAGNAAIAGANGPTGTPGTTGGNRDDQVTTNSDGTRTRTGTLSSHTQDSVVVSSNVGTKFTLSVDDKTSITVDGKKATVAELKAGMTISVTTDGGDHARSISATK